MILKFTKNSYTNITDMSIRATPEGEMKTDAIFASHRFGEVISH